MHAKYAYVLWCEGETNQLLYCFFVLKIYSVVTFLLKNKRCLKRKLFFVLSRAWDKGKGVSISYNFSLATFWKWVYLCTVKPVLGGHPQEMAFHRIGVILKMTKNAILCRNWSLNKQKPIKNTSNINFRRELWIKFYSKNHS